MRAPMCAGGAPAVDVTPMFSEEAVEQLLFGCPSDRRRLSNMPEAADTHLPAGTFRCAQSTLRVSTLQVWLYVSPALVAQADALGLTHASTAWPRMLPLVCPMCRRQPPGAA